MSTREEKLAQVERLSDNIARTIERAAAKHAFVRSTSWKRLGADQRAEYMTELANEEFRLWSMLRDRTELQQELAEEARE